MNLLRVIRKFIMAIVAFICYMMMLPMLVIGWTIYGFIKGIRVWSWNIVDKEFEGESWDLDFPKNVMGKRIK